MGTTLTNVRPLTDEELAAIEIPEFDRKYVKEQPLHRTGTVVDKDGNPIRGREFTASGPKADKVVRYVLTGGYTRKEIADFVGCSVSRVGEVLWAMDAAGVEHPEILRRRETPKPEAASVTEAEATETDEVEDEDAEA